MAAKQGLTAQVYQASEDARRAVLSRAPPSVRSHSWLSNLNTTCTIKSAPPRTPEVMSMLSTKAGWLIKRNEQHVWQRRWCCVVPHSFLYYFEAEPIEAAAAKLNPISEKEESLASGGHGQYHGQYDSSNGVPPPSTTHGPHSNQQPVGIIDLECYTTVERSSLDDDTLILELTGDAITNPDLRSFFFQGECEEDCERWTKAFLSDRHSALKDEREAYRQVCESFPLQLMHCSKMMDEAEDRQKGAERKAYSVRSAAEDSRKRVIQIVRDALEYEDHHHNDPNHHHDNHNFIENKNKNNKNDEQLDEKRRRFLHKLDRLTSEAVNMNAGVSESVEILAQYADMLRVERARFNTELIDMNSRVKDLGHSMISKKEMEHKERQLGKLTQQHSNEKKRMNDRINVLDSMLKEEKQRSEDAERTLEAKNMEFTMLSAASKQKIQELSGHKKILKREVIELRQKLEDISSDATVYRHKTEGLDMQVKVEKERNSVLERHLDHVTGQIKMQERMMENMSLAMSGSQAGSVYDDRSRNGGDSHSHYNGSQAGAGSGFPPKTPGGNNSVYGRGSHSVTGGQNHNEIPKYPPRNVPPEITSKPVTIDNNNNTNNDNNNQFNSRTNNNNNDNDNNNNPTNNSNTNARNIINNNNNNNNHGDSSQDDSYHSSQDSNHSSQDGIEALRNGRGTSNMMEDDESYEDDDDVSRGNLSELTEDRTFRAETIAGMLNNINVQKQQKKPEAIGVVSHGSSNIQDNSSSNPRLPKREVKSPTRNINNNNNSNNNDDHHQQTLQHHPPPYVDESINSKTPTPIRRSNSRSDYREPHRPPRMTSNTNNPPNRKVIQNLPTPQSSSQQQQPHIHPDTISISMSSLGGASVTSYGSKLSVAQRARLEAELSPSKAVRVEIDTVLNNDDVEESHTTNNDAHHNPVSPSGGSVWSRLGKSLVDTIDNSVLAVKVPNEVGGGGGGASVSSRDHRPVVEMEEKSVSHKSSQQQPPPPQQQPDKSLTLVQRMALQRDKQVAFLKQQGLLKEQQQRGSGGSVAGSVGSRRSQQHHHNDAGSLTGTSVSLSTGGGYRRGANV